MKKQCLTVSEEFYAILFKLWLLYGISQFITCLFAYLAALLNATFGIIETCLSPLILFVFYILVLRKKYIRQDNYCVAFLALWGVTGIIIPICNIAIRTVSLVLGVSNSTIWQISKTFSSFDFTMNILLLSFCYIICSFMLNRKWIILIGCTILVLYLILSMVSNQLILTIGSIATLSISTLFYRIVIIVGYFVASLIVRYSRNKEVSSCS